MKPGDFAFIVGNGDGHSKTGHLLELGTTVAIVEVNDTDPDDVFYLVSDADGLHQYVDAPHLEAKEASAAH